MQLKVTLDKLKILIALIFVLQGLSIAILAHPILKIHPWMRLVGILMFFGGLLYLYHHYTVSKALAEAEAEKEEKLRRPPYRRREFPSRAPMRRGRELKTEETVVVEQSIVTKIMTKFNVSARELSYLTMPIIGALIIDAVLIYNIFSGQGLALRSWDTITVMLGASLIAYNFIPEKYSVTRDFVVFFLAILFVILVLPQLFYSIIVGDEASANYTRILLAEPVAALLNLVGIDAFTEISTELTGTGPTAIIDYALAGGGRDRVGITEACSGIYTTSIFISAFITYVLVEYKSFNKKVVGILVIGIFISYLANILRMTVITVIGHYYGTDALLDAHANAGWLIFLAWIIPFWFLVFKYLIKEEEEVSGQAAG